MSQRPQPRTMLTLQFSRGEKKTEKEKTISCCKNEQEIMRPYPAPKQYPRNNSYKQTEKESQTILNTQKQMPTTKHNPKIHSRRKPTQRRERLRNPPTSVKDMNLVSLAVVLTITPKHINKLPTSNGVAGVSPPLSRPTSHLHCFALLFPSHFPFLFSEIPASFSLSSPYTTIEMKIQKIPRRPELEMAEQMGVCLFEIPSGI